jgi:uncharacterized membrane protein
MMGETSVAVILIISLALCVPPFLMLRLCARFYRRAQRRHLDTRGYLVAFVVALGGFLYNLGALVSIALRVTLGEGIFSPFHATAAAIAWVTFWVWLFMAFGLGRDIARRRTPK